MFITNGYLVYCKQFYEILTNYLEIISFLYGSNYSWILWVALFI